MTQKEPKKNIHKRITWKRHNYNIWVGQSKIGDYIVQRSKKDGKRIYYFQARTIMGESDLELETANIKSLKKMALQFDMQDESVINQKKENNEQIGQNGK